MIGVLAGTLIAAALSFAINAASTAAQNKYNAPKAMLKRLRKAGLPLAYMYRGGVSTQSDAPKFSIDSDLGTVEAEQVKASKLQREDLGLDIQAKGLPSGIEIDGVELNNRAAQQRAKSFVDTYEGELKRIEYLVEHGAFKAGVSQSMKQATLDKALQQIKNLLAQAGLMEQLKNIRGFEEQMNKSLTEDLDSMPDWISSLLKIILIATKRN